MRRRSAAPRMNSPSVVSTPMARPPSTTMRFGSVITRNSPPRFADGRLQRSRQRRGAAARHLRLGRAREQRRDVMAEAAHAKIDFAQAVEEQKARPHRRMLELLLHEFQRRQRADFKQAPAGGAALQQPAPLVRRQRWRLGFPCQDVLDDRDELMMPAAQRLGVLAAELLERVRGALDVRPPAQHAAVAGQQRDIQFWLDVVRAVALQLEVRIPRHRRDGALEECVRVVKKARMARIFQRR